MDQQHQRDICDAQGNRNALAQALMDNTHLQGERGINPPLRDKYNRYSVTGMAAATLTPALWVLAEGQWRYFHPEWFYDQEMIRLPGTRQFRQEWKVDREKLNELEERAGDGIVQACPEEVSCALGLKGETETLHLQLRRETLNEEQRRMIGPKATHLDQLDFAGAARLLREAPEILEPCSCGEPPEWMLSMNLWPDAIIECTEDPGDRLEPEDIVLAGMLFRTGMIGDGDERQMMHGRHALRDALISQTGRRIPMIAEPPTTGARLTQAARELRKAAGECREEHRRFIRQNGWARPENFRILEEANQKYDEARLAALRKHGLI